MILNINFINLLNTSDKHKFLKVIIAQSIFVRPKNISCNAKLNNRSTGAEEAGMATNDCATREKNRKP